MKIIISEHARERFQKRWTGTQELTEELVKKIIIQGEGLTKSLLRTTVLLGFVLSGYWTSIYKIYNNFIFIFRREKDLTYVLISIIPLKWLKDRRREMILNHQKKYDTRKKKRL